MRKKLCMVLALAMAMATVMVPVHAAGDNADKPMLVTDPVVSGSAVTVIVSGSVVESAQPAVILNDRTMVPFRVIAEALGCDVDWVADTKTVVMTKDGLTASMTIGANKLVISDGEIDAEVDIDTPATIINSRTMVPVRFLSEYFGFDVEWDAATRTVTVNDAKAEETTVEATTEETTEAAKADEETTEAAEADEETTEAVDEATTEDTTVEETTAEDTTVEETTNEATTEAE